MNYSMNYGKFLDRLLDWKIPIKNLARITDLSESTIYRHINDGKRLPGDAIYAIADDLHLTGAEVAEELLGIKPRREEGTVTYSEIVDVILRAAEEAKR